MATLEDIVAASKILSEDPESKMGNSGSKPKESRGRASDVRKDDGVSAADAVVDEQDVESETVVESTFGEGRETTSVESLSRMTYTGSSVRVNGNGSCEEPVKSGGKNEVGEDSLADNGEGMSTGYRQLNGSGRDDLHLDVDGDGGGGIGEKLKDHGNGFHVGDFVWGKIRSHPWWPGQVYDPKDASEFAMKHKQEGRHLVAFFGDGSCSWCSPSQLIPFVENFLDMSTDSSSKSFLNAVQSAVDEVGRLVESEMTCNCMPKEEKHGLAPPVMENAGLKAGVVVPELDVRRLSVPILEPAEVLEKVMQLAKDVSIGSALDLAVLRSWLSAFYYLKGGYLLPVYREPLLIEGLEDKNKNVNEVANDFSVPIEVPILGPQDDDWLSSPTVGSVNPLGPAENKVTHKRKQKSVAELMGQDKNIKPESRKRASVKEGADVENSSSSQKRKKSNDGEVGNEGASSTGKKGRKRKVEVPESPGKKGRKRKVEVPESPKVTRAKDSNAEASGFRGADGVNGGPLLRKPKVIEVATVENASGEAKEELEKASSPRERKKSKYLSPPYTNLAWRTGNSSSKALSEVEHDRSATIAQVGEQKKEATRDDFASQSISKSVDDVSEEKLPNGQLESLNVSDDKSSHTVTNKKKLNVSDDKSSHTVTNKKKLSFSVSDLDAPINELLSDIELAACNPFYLSKKGSLDMVRAFVSALRSSIHLHGRDYKIYHKCKADGSLKSQSLQPEDLGNDLTQNKAKLADRSTSKASKSEKKSDASNSDKAAETSVARNTMDSIKGKTLPCLILEFAPGFPLPSKKDIMRLFGKIGTLNKKETKVETGSNSIRVVYMKDSDAEAAFKSSLSQSPFGPKNVNYRLQHSSANSKSRTPHPKVSSPLKRALERREASHPADDLVLDINTIRQKLEITAAIVENYHSKFSLQDKSSLKDEMKHLMEKVETISDQVRVMAEKSSS